MSDRGVVLVVVVAAGEEDSDDGRAGERIARFARGSLAAGRRLAGALDLDLELLLVSSSVGMEGLPRDTYAGVVRVLLARLEERSDWARRARALDVALARVARSRSTRYLLSPHDYAAVERLPALAAGLDAAPLAGVVALEIDGQGRVVWSRPSHQGKLQERLASAAAMPVVATVRAEGFPEDSPEGKTLSPPSAERVTLELGEAPPVDLEWLRDEADEAAFDLASASRLVSVGRGLGDPERLGPIRELADALGAELAGSRPVIDAGWLARERQVGSSGATVSPDLYVALGISGSAQHLAGMSASKCIVAVNRDPEAPIFRVADFGVVGDLHQVAPQITRALVDDE